MKLFHITPSHQLQSIISRGLIPNEGIGFTSKHSQRRGMVWLTDDIEFIMKSQLTEWWVNHHQAVTIEVDVNGLNVHRLSSFDGHEFIYHGVISSDRLRLMGKTVYRPEWTPVVFS